MTDAHAVYLDHNATTPPAPEVLRAVLDTMTTTWGNASSTHPPGQAARRLLADARQRVARFLGAQPAEVVFTSGATEANHAAVRGALAVRRGEGRRAWWLSAVEHPALLALAARLEAEGVPVHRMPVDRHGRLRLQALHERPLHDVALISVMGANNETGVLQPLDEVAAAAHAGGAWLHVDATQLAGKAPLRFDGAGIDLLTLSAHKLHGPKGVGALLVRRGLSLPALLEGRQERRRRGGTENLPAIAGFAAACDRALATLDADVVAMRGRRDRLEAALRAALPGVRCLGEGAPRLANTSCLRFGDLDAEVVLARLERAGVHASSGAACSAGGTAPSHVLLAMGESPSHARGGVRLSLARTTTDADIDIAIDVLCRALSPLLTPLPTLENAA